MNEQDTQELLPCPFCKGKPRVRHLTSVECSDCSCSIQGPSNIANFIKWNTRAAMPDTKWQASDGDTRCQKCAVSNPVWHAPNKVWNRIVGGPDAIDDPAGVLCPNCFMAMSDEMWVVAPKAAMPDTTAQADTVTPQQAAKVLIGNLGLDGIRDAHQNGDGCPRSSSLGFAESTYRTLRAIAGESE